MIVLLIVGILMLFSAVLVIAAGIMSSRISRQEEWIETYEVADPDTNNVIGQTIE